MAFSLEASPGPSGSRGSAGDDQTSIRSTDSEDTVIHKTVLRTYESAALPSIYNNASLENFMNNRESTSYTPLDTAPDNEKNNMDANAVGWDSEDDPENPLNWPKWKKALNFSVVFLIAFVSPFASSVFAPAINDMMQDFRETDLYLSAFVVSVYVLGYAVGPLIISPLSEIYGRVIMYRICNIIFVVFSCLCAKTTNLSGLAVMRFFAGCGGASAFALGPATVVDIVRFERRGGLYALLGMAYNLGPAVSPTVGSYLNDAMNWPWIFWLTALMGALCTICSFALSESYEPVLLRRKAARLRKETGNQNLRSILELTPNTHLQILKTAMLRPLKMLTHPNVFLVSLLTAVGYGYMYILYTTMPVTILAIYAWEPKKLGLAYLGTAIGNLLGMALGGPLMDAIVRKRAAAGDRRAENRLIPMMFFWPLVTVGFVMYGWTAYKEGPWYVALLGTAIFGMGSMAAILFCGAYVVDCYTMHSASAAAATTVLRSLLGGLVPLFSYKMYGALGVGWMYTTLGLVALAFWPIPMYFFKKRKGVAETV